MNTNRFRFLLSAYLIVWPLVNLTDIDYLACLVFLALVDVAFNRNAAIDRILIGAVSILGIVPLGGWFGWVPLVDPLAFAISLWLMSIATARQERLRLARPSLTLLPAVAGSVFTYQWWNGISKGSPAEVLERLAPLWDTSSHFLFFFSNLSSGRFIAMLPSPGEGLTWAGREYPAGIHHVWARFASGSREIIQDHPEKAIPIFANSVVTTVAVSVLAVGLAVARLGSSEHRQLSYSFLGTGACVSIVSLGPLSQTVYAGFSNMSAVVIGVTVFGSFFLRPLANSRLQLWVLSCSTLTVMYNWYPIALLLAPALVSSFIHEFRTVSRANSLLTGSLLLVAGTPAVVQTLSLGINHVEAQGGVQPFPPGVLALILFSSSSLALLAVGFRGSWRVSALNSMPLLLVLSFGLYLKAQTDSYPYYFHKASLMIGSCAAILVVMGVVVLLETWNPVREFSTRKSLREILSIVGVAVFSLGLTNSFGYWGLDYPTFSGSNTAIGVLARNEMTKGNTEFLPMAQLVIRRANSDLSLATKEKSCLTLLVPERLGAQEGSKYGPWTLTLYNVWYHSLTSSYTLQAMEQAYMSPNVAPAAGNEADFVSAIEKTYDPSSMCVYSSDKVINELRERSDRWTLKSLED